MWQVITTVDSARKCHSHSEAQGYWQPPVALAAVRAHNLTREEARAFPTRKESIRPVLGPFPRAMSSFPLTREPQNRKQCPFPNAGIIFISFGIRKTQMHSHTLLPCAFPESVPCFHLAFFCGGYLLGSLPWNEFLPLSSKTQTTI